MPIELREQEVDHLLRVGNELDGPAFVYFERIINDRWALLKAGLPEGFEIFYSYKANPFPNVVAKIKSLDAGIDVASLRELRGALDLAFAPNKISFVGPGKSPLELRAGVESSAHLVVESIEEAKSLDQLAGILGKNIKISVRINPCEYVGNFGRKTVQAPCKFGVDEEKFPSFWREIQSLKHLQLEGFHVYTQSQLLSPDSLCENFGRTLNLAVELSRAYGFALNRINFGGGFGVPYFTGDKELNLATLKTTLSESIRELHSTRFLVESGRYLVADCGFYLTRVLYKKESRGKIFVVTDGGINHYMAATGLDQSVKKNFPVFNLSKFDRPADEEVTLAGPTCYFADILARQVQLPSTAAGDILCIGFAGAYGPTFSPVDFLGRAPAHEIFLPC
jgi:diaminopimelate decarboxylase